jgi:hypothetical protein
VIDQDATRDDLLSLGLSSAAVDELLAFRERLKALRARARHLCAGGCGYPVPYAGEACGECACEDDS